MLFQKLDQFFGTDSAANECNRNFLRKTLEKINKISISVPEIFENFFQSRKTALYDR